MPVHFSQNNIVYINWLNRLKCWKLLTFTLSFLQEFSRFHHHFLYTISFFIKKINILYNYYYFQLREPWFILFRCIIFPELYYPTILIPIYFWKNMASGVAVKTGKKKTRGKVNRKRWFRTHLLAKDLKYLHKLTMFY